MLSVPATARPQRLSRLQRRNITIETTLASLARHGAEGTSLRSVCRDMHVAPSLITHSFSGWHDILVASFTLLTERFLSRLSILLTQTFDDAQARMRAMIGCALAAEWAGETMVGAMVAFWHLSRTLEALKGPFDRFACERHRLLSHAVGAWAVEAGAEIDTDEATEALVLMMDGIWLHMSLTPNAISVARAQAMCVAWIAARLAQKAAGLPSATGGFAPWTPTGVPPASLIGIKPISDAGGTPVGGAGGQSPPPAGGKLATGCARAGWAASLPSRGDAFGDQVAEFGV